MGGFYTRKSVSANGQFTECSNTCMHRCTYCFGTEQPQSNVYIVLVISTDCDISDPPLPLACVCMFTPQYTCTCNKILCHNIMLLYWQVLSHSALEIYKSCIDQLDYEAFFKGAVATTVHPLITLVISLSSNATTCSMPDTLQSWFLVAQLHIWLGPKREGKDGLM